MKNPLPNSGRGVFFYCAVRRTRMRCGSVLQKVYKYIPKTQTSISLAYECKRVIISSNYTKTAISGENSAFFMPKSSLNRIFPFMPVYTKEKTTSEILLYV